MIESADNEQLKNYMKIVQDMESTGLISKPLTPIRDTRPVFPNKADVPIIGISATIIIGIVELDTVVFLSVGAAAITIAGLYFWELERGRD